MSAYRIKVVFISKLLLLLPTLCFTQTKTLPFQNLSAGSGQDVNFIYNITQDKQGFLWLGTLNGLVRYDGYNFKNYSAEDGSGLKGRRVNDVEEDKYGNLWVVSGLWLQVYNPQSDSFHNIENLDGDTIFHYSTSGVNPIMVKEENGTIWMRSIDGLFRIEPRKIAAESIIKRYHYHSGNTTLEGSDYIQALLLDRRQRLWIGTKNGLLIFNNERDCIELCPVEVRAPITALCESVAGQIVIGTQGAGFYFYDPATQTVSKFIEDKKNPASLAGESIYQIVRDGKSTIWLLAGSFDDGNFSLQRFDPVSGRFKTYFRNQKAKGGMASLGGVGFHIFKDRAGYLWIVGNNGLQFFDPYLEVMYDIREREKHPIDWSGIFTIYEDQTGVVWMGTASTGLLKFAPSTYKFNVIMPESGVSNSSSFILPIFEDSGGNLWRKSLDGTDRYVFDERSNLRKIAHYSFNVVAGLETGKGILWLTTMEGTKYFDPKTGKFLQLPDSPVSTIPGIKELEDADGWIWSRTFGQGLFHFHPSTGEVVNFRHDPKNPNSISSDYLGGVMLKDNDGIIWVGGYGGLNKYHPETGHFSTYLKDIATTDLHEDKSGQIWVTTEGWGLYRFDKKTGATRRYSKKEGFPANRPKFILEDGHGDLWISSDAGLIHFWIESETWHLYNEQDGLPTSVFAYGRCKRKNGEMLFSLWGGGLIRFHPDSLRDDTFPPKTAFVDFKLFNQPVAIGGEDSPLSASIWATNHLVLRHDQNVFSLEFSALHFAAPDKNEFAYFMEGIDHEWNIMGNQRIVNFAGLQPGEYTFKVKAANHDGLWGEEEVLKITILPPWWATWWAYLLYAALFFGGIILFYRFQLRRRLEHAETLRLQELDTVKTKLYTNITHEFRTPLTVILGMARQVLDNPKEHFRYGLDMIIRNGQNLLHLVNQMLDLSKLESGKLSLHLRQGDVVNFLKYLVESFHSLAESKDIKIHFLNDVEALAMDFDAERLQQVVSNLLSNAVKFTPEGGHVYLSVGSGSSSSGQVLLIKVKDTGVGISEESLPYIFDRFYQADDTHTRHGEGTGIGLALAKELVKLMEGDITVKSTPGKGTEFAVTLPVRQTAEINGNNGGELPWKVRETEGVHPSLPFVNQAPAEKPLVLIAEDNADVVTYLASCLAADYRLAVAKDGQECEEMAFSIIPDLIVTDVMMPRKDGFEVCETLKKDERTSHIPIIMLTAKADTGSKLEGLERGADAYLMKPFHKEELLVRIKKLLELRQKLQQHYLALAGLAESTAVEKEILPVSNFENAFVTKARGIVEAHLDDFDFDVEKFCRALTMSHPQVHRKLTALTGLSANKFIRSIRLSKAKSLLLNPELSITAVAFDSGFSDPSYFGKVFKQEFGLTPMEWRERHCPRK